MKFSRCLSAACAALAFFAWTAGAQPHHGSVPPASGPIRIDGRIDEPAWQQALPIDIPFEVAPAQNVEAPVRTVCLVTYDRDRLYVAFRAYDRDPSRIRAHVADRDGAFRNDYVGILLDPFHDGRRGFSFMVNPLGVQMDSTSTDLGGTSNGPSSVSGAPAEDFSWDAIWYAAGRITADGYEVEIAIPFSSLRFPRDQVQTWAVLAFRAWPRDTMHKLRSVPLDLDRNCFFCQFGTIDGLAGLTPGPNLEFDPTVTVTRADTMPDYPDGVLEHDRARSDVGLSARWGVTPNLSLNAALNPDFSQVEADAAQLSINRQFALYFPEKRPFFQEGADFFNTPFRAVYSRVVADPSWGAKLTGKEGPNAMGFFIARDRVTQMVYPGNEGSDTDTLLEPNTTAALRYRRDIGESSALGGLVTSRQGADYYNRVYGTDGYLRLGRTDKLVFQYLRSETRDPGEDRGRAGTAWSVDYSHAERDWDAWAMAHHKGRAFRADAGFIPRVDIREYDAGFDRFWYGGPGRWFNKLRVTGEVYHGDAEDGSPLGRSASFGFGYDGPLQSTFHGAGWWERDWYHGTEYKTDGGDLFFNIRPTGDLTSSIDLNYGRAIDYDNERPGYQLDITPGVTYNVGRHLYLQLDHTYERFTRDEGTLYTANLTQFRLVYQFTVRLFVRAIVQRDVVERNQALYVDAVDAREENVLGQYLVSYKINPQTVVFLGYADTHAALGERDRLLRDRTLFLKLGYAWVM